MHTIVPTKNKSISIFVVKKLVLFSVMYDPVNALVVFVLYFEEF